MAEAGDAALSIAAQVYPERGATLVPIYATDHPGLFYRAARAIHVAGGNIIDAPIHPTPDGMALDTFLVPVPFAPPLYPPAHFARHQSPIEYPFPNPPRPP